MTTREKIIVGMMCVTIVYGAYELISGGTGKRKPAPAVTSANPMEDLRRFVTDMSKSLVGEQAGKQYHHLITQAATGWSKDPFIQTIEPLKSQLSAPSATQPESGQQAESFAFIYSGFLEVGGTRLAVINEMEYAVGESLGDTGYLVKTITSQLVVIGKIDGLQTIRLPLREIDSEPIPPTQEKWN